MRNGGTTASVVQRIDEHCERHWPGERRAGLYDFRVAERPRCIERLHLAGVRAAATVGVRLAPIEMSAQSLTAVLIQPIDIDLAVFGTRCVSSARPPWRVRVR